jgi:arabinan endo-1,5-alpha-L-arabinosidase
MDNIVNSPLNKNNIHPQDTAIFSVGHFIKVFDQGQDETGVPWHVNDHCFFLGPDNTWHVIGITYPDPGYDSYSEGALCHATARELTQTPWNKQPFALLIRRDLGETVVWAPHIISHQNKFYMFYCSGDSDPVNFGISLAISNDLWNWTRHPKVLFRDGYQGRDPMVLWLHSEQKWIIYYCATDNPFGGHHAVAYRTSSDLINWSERSIAYIDPIIGTDYGPTESPFVVQRGKYYYLFIGPRPYDYPTPEMPNWEHPGYDGTDVFRSQYCNHWTPEDYIGHIAAHALEVVRDRNGKWYVSHAGTKRGGLYLAELKWNDGLD